VVFVGAAVWDAIALVRHYPEPDERIVADDVRHAGGGPAATAAVAAVRLGVPAAFIGAVGDDDDGARIVAALQAEHVDVRGVSVVAGSRSAASVAVADGRRGTRAICTRPGPGLRLTGTALALLRSARWVHVDHAGWAPVHGALRTLTASRRPWLSVDAGNPIDGLVLADVELFAPSAAMLASRYGTKGSGIGTLLDAVLAEGARQVVATLGAAGCAAATSDGERCTVPGHPADVVSTLGAGDVFHGALLAAAERGLRFRERLRYANAAAALSCRALDGRSAIPAHDEVIAAIGMARADG
jgi:sulfofructose kinase